VNNGVGSPNISQELVAQAFAFAGTLNKPRYINNLNNIRNNIFRINYFCKLVITPTFGSMVQNGKFAACAFAFDKQLKSVDLPTFGKPTIPHCKPMYIS